MILARYTHFRQRFALSEIDLAVDGFPRWPVELTGVGNGWIEADSGTGKAIGTINKLVRPYDALLTTGMNISCNGGLDDEAVATTYDWYLSQRTDDVPGQCWSLTCPPADANSGKVKLRLLVDVARKLVPTGDLLSPDALAILAANCHLYVKRNGLVPAIQFVRFVTDPNAYDTGLYDPFNAADPTLFSTGLFTTVGY